MARNITTGVYFSDHLSTKKHRKHPFYTTTFQKYRLQDIHSILNVRLFQKTSFKTKRGHSEIMLSIKFVAMKN
jgi:hypothetical protein